MKLLGSLRTKLDLYVMKPLGVLRTKLDLSRLYLDTVVNEQLPNSTSDHYTRNFRYSRTINGMSVRRSVLDVYFLCFRGNVLCASLFLGLVLFGIGLLIAIFGGFQLLYLYSRQVYLVISSVVFATAILHIASKSYVKYLADLRLVLDVSDAVYLSMCEEWLKRLYDGKGMFRWSATITMVVVIWGTLKFYLHTTSLPLNWLTVPPGSLDPAWYNPPSLEVKIIVANFFFIIASPIMAVTLRAIILHIRFVRVASRHPTLSNFYFVAEIFRRLSDRHAFVVVAGLVAIGFLVLMWLPRFSEAAIGGYVFWAFAFLGLFVGPAYEFHNALNRLKRELLEAYAAAHLTLLERQENIVTFKNLEPETIRSLSELKELSTSIQQASTWVWFYSLPALIVILTSLVIPLLVTAIESVLFP